MYAPGYMAPEVQAGQSHSYPSDVYAWAATMQWMLRYRWAPASSASSASSAAPEASSASSAAPDASPADLWKNM